MEDLMEDSVEDSMEDPLEVFHDSSRKVREESAVYLAVSFVGAGFVQNTSRSSNRSTGIRLVY